MHGGNTQFTRGFHQRNLGISQLLTIKHDWKMGKTWGKKPTNFTGDSMDHLDLVYLDQLVCGMVCGGTPQS